MVNIRDFVYTKKCETTKTVTNEWLTNIKIKNITMNAPYKWNYTTVLQNRIDRMKKLKKRVESEVQSYQATIEISYLGRKKRKYQWYHPEHRDSLYAELRLLKDKLDPKKDVFAKTSFKKTRADDDWFRSQVLNSEDNMPLLKTPIGPCCNISRQIMKTILGLSKIL